MSLRGSVVGLYILCCLLAAASSTSVNRNLVQSDPESQLNNTHQICPDCSTSLSESSQRNASTSPPPLNTTTPTTPTQQPHDANKLVNRTMNNDEPILTNKINDSSTAQVNISSPEEHTEQETSPPDKVVDPPTSPKATSAPLTKGRLANATTALAITPAHTTAITLNTSTTTTSAAATTNTTTTTSSPNKTFAHPLTTTTAAVNANTSSTTSAAASATTTTTTTTTTTVTTTTTTTTPLLSTKTSTRPSTTIAPAPSTVKAVTISPKQITPDATTTTTTTTTTSPITTPSAPTGQYLSPVVKQLVDRASLLALLLFGLLFFLVVVAVFVTQAYESYRRKDYTQVDYLINGMYTDSGV